jgi:hypothetical protein
LARLILTAPNGGLRAEEAESIYGELRQQLSTQLDRVERVIGRG